MLTDKIIEAIGLIDEELIFEAKNQKIKVKFGKRKFFALIAAVILCMIFVVTAYALKPYYKEIYKSAEQLIQNLKPVKMSSVDSGVKMEVISASVADNEAIIYISMQDIDGNKIDESFDIYDSYNISGSFDNYGYCEKISYDKETKTAFFLVRIGRTDGKTMKDGKITFTVDESISGKITYNDYIDIDLSSVQNNPTTREITDRSGGGYDGTPEMKKIYDNLKSLVPQEKYFSPFPGATITAMGYIDGKLHIQMLYENRHETDCHGFVHFVDENNKKIQNLMCVYYWDENGSFDIQKGIFGREVIQYYDTYFEQVFDISPDELKNCRMYGEFITHENFIDGKWSVTFNIEDLY
ncbi:MAG: hypothetical protein IKU42_03085 [Oscillospiraceae bacterium]|nr:hypothetical protein [Oscillospiraceae bacterium]